MSGPSPINQGPISGTFRSAMNVVDKFGGEVNTFQLGLMVQMERHKIVGDQMKGQFEEMQRRNEWLKDATSALNALRAGRPGDETKEVDLNTLSYTGSDGKPHKVADFLRENGIQAAGGKMKGPAFDNAIANFKASIDQVNNTSQLDMVRLQGLSDAANRAIDQMTNWISKNSKTLDGIVQNMR